MNISLKHACRLLLLTISLLTFAVAGFTSTASAVGPTITNTGPYSTNTIDINKLSNCEVNNTAQLNTNSTTLQSAESGDVTFAHNTSIGSSWNALNPAEWQAQGKTYAEWKSALEKYISERADTWDNTSNTNFHGNGSASSGDATNNNSATVAITIKNGSDQYCVEQDRLGQDNPKIDNPSATTTIPLSARDLNNATGDNSLDRSGSGLYGGTFIGGVSSGASNPYIGGTGSSYSGVGVPTPDNSIPSEVGNTISNTGPDSHNIITTNNSAQTNITNNSTVSIVGYTNQESATGSTSVHNNTSSASAQSGDGINGQDSSVGIVLDNATGR